MHGREKGDVYSTVEEQVEAGGIRGRGNWKEKGRKRGKREGGRRGTVRLKEEGEGEVRRSKEKGEVEGERRGPLFTVDSSLLWIQCLLR